MTGLIPTSAQLDAIVDIATTERRITRLHGYAGTGKTSVVATEAIAALERRDVSVQVLAPTGKAAKVLRSKGLHGACTIHSYLYAPSKRERRAWREIWEAFAEKVQSRYPELGDVLQTIDTAVAETNLDAEWSTLAKTLPPKAVAIAERLQEDRRYELAFTASGAIAYFEDYGIPAAEVLLVDEASMVSAGVAEDLRRTGSRIVYVGDPAQLPPVKAQRSDDAMGPPHHLLDEVHRQKGGSPVLRLATEIRAARIPAVEPTKRKRLLSLEEYDQVLCWRNATREHVNAETRRRLGRAKGIVPEAGDRLVCLKNTKARENTKQWMNGEQATVLDADRRALDRDTLYLTVRDDEGVDHEVTTWLSTFGGHRAEQAHLDRSGWASPDPAFAFGYALTVHKAQGSEWRRVLLVDESSDMISMTQRREGREAALDQALQWLYTGCTRASEEIHVVRSLRDLP